MSGDDDNLERRANDVKIDELIAKVDAIAAWQKMHLVDYHTNLAPKEGAKLIEEHKELMVGFRERGELMERVINVLEGEEVRSPLTDEVVGHNLGTVAKVDALYRQSQNGGISARFRLTAWQKSIITMAFGLLTALLWVGVEVLRTIQ